MSDKVFAFNLPLVNFSISMQNLAGIRRSLRNIADTNEGLYLKIEQVL